VHLLGKLPAAVLRLSPAIANRWPAKAADVDLRDIYADAQPLLPDKLLSIASAKDLPAIAVVHWQGNLYLWDGHHRAMVSWIRGIYVVSAMVQALPDGGGVTGIVRG